MYCKICGTKNEEDACFCVKCGKIITKINQDSIKKYENNKCAVDEKNVSENENNKKVLTVKEERSLFINWKIIVITILMLSVLYFFLKGWKSNPVINLNEYVETEVSGYNGYAKANIKIDWIGIEKDYGQKLKFINNDEIKELLALGIYNTPIDLLKGEVTISYDQNNKLKNGDTVVYKINVDEEYINYVKCNLKSSEAYFNVHDLIDIGTFDAFEGLEVVFSGISPNGKAECKYNGKYMNIHDFVIDKKEGLTNGESIKVSLAVDNLSEYIDRIGAVPLETEKIYKVDGLKEYITKYSDISESMKKSFKSYSEDVIYAYVAQKYDKNMGLSDLQYSGYIFSTAKKQNEKNVNELYIIYCGTVSHSKGKFRTSKVYYPIKFTNIEKGDSVVYEGGDKIIGKSNIDGKGYGTAGYTNPTACYQDIVEANLDKYSSYCGDGFEDCMKNEEISSINDVDLYYMDELILEGTEVVHEYIEKRKDYWIASYEPVCAGTYLLIAKNQSSNIKENNKLIVVYTTQVTDYKKGKYVNLPVLFPVEFDGITKQGNGEYIVSSMKGIQGKFTFPHTLTGCHGYMDGNLMFSELVQSERSNYTYEVSEGLQIFGY